LSFFDEDDEPPRTTRTRTRAAPPPRRGRPVRSGPPDQNILVRRLVAGITIAVMLVLLVIVVRACNQSRHENALKEYNRQVSGIATQSRQTGSEFFKLMDQAATQSPSDLYQQILSFRGSADTALKQAQAIDPPDDMRQAHNSLLIALELRRDGLEGIAERIRPALGDEGEAADKAIRDIAGQMQMFTASDVIYRARVTRFIEEALNNAEIGGQTIDESPFMADIAWQSDTFVAARLDHQLSRDGDGDGDGAPPEGQTTGPGLHGTGLDATSYGNVTLQPGASNRLSYVPGQPFLVAFTNQGDNDEFNVKVTLRIARDSGSPITLTKRVPTVAKGERVTVTLPLNKEPPLGTVVTINVTVHAVPGEEKTDNNKASYPTLFEQG
jgi:hypothetical protein